MERSSGTAERDETAAQHVHRKRRTPSNVAALFPGLRRVTFHLAPDVTDVPEHLLAFLPDTAAVTIEKTDSVV